MSAADFAYCKERGYHGPFIDRERFIAAGGMWADQGTCFYCHSTVDVPTEEAKRQKLAEADCANVIGERRAA